MKVVRQPRLCGDCMLWASSLRHRPRRCTWWLPLIAEAKLLRTCLHCSQMRFHPASRDHDLLLCRWGGGGCAVPATPSAQSCDHLPGAALGRVEAVVALGVSRTLDIHHSAKVWLCGLASTVM